MLKALGIEGETTHNVLLETLENLLHLTHNPEGIFKSLSTSRDTNAYVAILDAKAKNQKQVIAILSPSRDGKGFTFIPTVYERENFEHYIDRTHAEKKALYIKDKGSELWGRLQGPPRHNSEPYIKSILTKDDVVKLINEKNLEQNKEKMTENPAYGERGNRAWEQNLYLKGKAAEIRAARQSQHEAAIEMAHGLKEINSKGKSMENENQDAEQVEREVKSSAELLREMNFRDKEGELSLEDKLSLYVSLHGKEEFFNLSDKIDSLHEEQKQLDLYPDLNNEQFFEGLYEIEKTLKNLQKEKSIENENQGTEQAEPLSKRSQEESYYLHNALKQRDTILDSIENGTSACLPREDGYADTKPAVNLINQTKYHSSTLLYLKEHQRANGYPTAEYLTADQVNEARKENKAIGIMKGEKGVVINLSTYNKDTGEYDKSNVRLFNVAQTTKPGLLREYAGRVQEIKANETEKYLHSQHGDFYKPPEKKAPPQEISCTSTKPSTYLAQYLAAVSLGSKFRVSEEQAKEFSKNFENQIMEKGDNGYPNPFKLGMVCNQASKECKTIMTQLNQEQKKEIKKDVDIDR